jgi:hypothetical protein
VVDELATESALEPTPLSRVAGAVDVALARVFTLFDALAIIAVIVAALGIVNTLSMNVLERVRELGVPARGRDDPAAGPADGRRRGRDPRAERLVPRHRRPASSPAR